MGPHSPKRDKSASLVTVGSHVIRGSAGLLGEEDDVRESAVHARTDRGRPPDDRR